MSKSFTCPYCNSVFPITSDTFSKRTPNFYSDYRLSNINTTEVEIDFFRCPKCDEFTIFAIGNGANTQFDLTPLKPISLAQQFPDYIPKAIREDYEEAYAILNLSPKSSATLSRRCLQGMIHDFWDIHEKNLNAEITSLKDKVSPTLWEVLNGVRSIGNIGAHMEHDINKIVDIEPDEAIKLIKLIEFLIKEWYINRHEQEKLFADIIDIAETKEIERKSSK